MKRSKDRRPLVEAPDTGENAMNIYMKLESSEGYAARPVFPELEDGSGSWIVTHPTIKDRVFEFFERKNAAFVFARGWEVETAMQYLTRINRTIREKEGE